MSNDIEGFLKHARETDEQVKKLQELYEILKAYYEKVKDEENLQKILDDPEWQRIQTLAKEIVILFGFEP